MESSGEYLAFLFICIKFTPTNFSMEQSYQVKTENPHMEDPVQIENESTPTFTGKRQ
jgi:hypothetical protein